jgi:GTP-binding protein
VFHGWAPHKGPIPGRRAGVLISMENGQAVAYALWGTSRTGRMFIGAQEEVYEGMIIGEHSRDNDLEVNPLKGKKLTNVRASGKDEAVRLTTAGQDVAGRGHRLYRRRRAGRGHAERHPAAQALPRPA